ncbi:hypothetical protein COSO111634_28880 [Corallococcus soli]
MCAVEGLLPEHTGVILQSGYSHEAFLRNLDSPLPRKSTSKEHYPGSPS